MWPGISAKKSFCLNRMAAVGSTLSFYLKAESFSEIDPSSCHIFLKKPTYYYSFEYAHSKTLSLFC